MDRDVQAHVAGSARLDGGLPQRVTGVLDDAFRVLNGYSIQAAHIAGMSLGGMIAQELALAAFDADVAARRAKTHIVAPPGSGKRCA